MLYFFEFEVTVPHSMPPEQFQQMRDEERSVVQSLQRSGEMEHLWRVAGKFASMGILNVTDNDRLHAIISSLPLFTHMRVRVVPLSRHQAAVDSATDM